VQRANGEKPQSNTPAGGQGVGQRWLTAFIAIPIVLSFVIVGGWWAFIGSALIVLVVAYELHTMMLHAGYHPIMPVSVALGLLFLVGAMLPAQRVLLIEGGLSGYLLISFPWLFARKKLEGALVDWALTLALAVYVGLPLSFFLLLRGYAPMWPMSGGPWWLLPAGVWWVLVSLLGVWGFDAAAFFTGRAFGRHKLSPRISPNKSWEGVGGGLILSIAASLILTVRPLGVPWYLAILLGLLIGVAAIVGDLAESLIKRQADVKDSGQLMPGHGGLLDRVDSVMFVVIVVYFFARLFGR
jgi:phosphatidate cytidylyltransferase